MFENISAEEYKAQFHDSETPHILLDVRTEEEYEQARIPGAVNIPLDELDSRVDEVLSLAGEKPVVVVCRTGQRSMVAIQMVLLNELDDEQIYHLYDGTMGWAQNRFPLDQG